MAQLRLIIDPTCIPLFFSNIGIVKLDSLRYLFIDYAEAAKQTYTHTKKNDKSSKHKRHENTKKTYTTDTANVFHTDFLIKDTELSNR